MSTLFEEIQQHCPHCQKVNPWDTRLCVSCGKPMKMVEATPPWLRDFFKEYEESWKQRREG